MNHVQFNTNPFIGIETQTESVPLANKEFPTNFFSKWIQKASNLWKKGTTTLFGKKIISK